jgi:uncharacterized membrane protein
MTDTAADVQGASPAQSLLRHPVVVAELRRRREDVQLRVADAITSFAGSMNFVYLHVLLFAAWMLLLEKSPWPTLTLVVSLEAIFLSTFVMIGQNRQSVFQQAKANHDFSVAEQELHDDTEITRLVHQLTLEIHERLLGTEHVKQSAPGKPQQAPPES